VIGLAQPGLPSLTKRQEEILLLVAEGLPDKQIGKRLKISASTVHFHVNKILVKLDMPNRASSVAFALRQGIIQ
jgi:DNA-binding NarL/FixJ family response regulator